jgi:uncharacterized protein (DUF433 family)
MSTPTASVQRSIRLSGKTDSLLTSVSEREGQTRNSMVERLLAESLRTFDHPLIQFRSGGSGRREPGIAGTRILVRQVIAQVRAENSNIEAVADYLAQPVSLIQAAVNYYADHADEIDADADWAARVEDDAQARWLRQQALLK